MYIKNENNNIIYDEKILFSTRKVNFVVIFWIFTIIMVIYWWKKTAQKIKSYFFNAHSENQQSFRYFYHVSFTLRFSHNMLYWTSGTPTGLGEIPAAVGFKTLEPATKVCVYRSDYNKIIIVIRHRWCLPYWT